MLYAVRITECIGFQERLEDVFTSELFTRVLCVRHTGRKSKNPHFHLVLDATFDIQTETYQKKLKKYFPGERKVSVKEWDGDNKACSYLFHEGTDELFSKGFTPKEIEIFKLQDIAIRDDLQSKGPKNVCVIVAKQYTELPKDKWTHYSKFQRIGYLIFDYYREQGDWIPNKYQMERYIRQVLVLLAGNDKEKWEETRHLLWQQMGIERN